MSRPFYFCVTYCLLIIGNCFSVTQLQKGRLLKTLPKQEIEWKMSFELEAFGRNAGWTNVIQFVDSGTTSDSTTIPGARTPAIFLKGSDIYLCFNTDARLNTFHKQHIPLDQKIEYIMEQVLVPPSQNPIIRIWVDGQKVYERTHNLRIPFIGVRCYISSPWFTSSPVYVSNFEYIDFNME